MTHPLVIRDLSVLCMQPVQFPNMKWRIDIKNAIRACGPELKDYHINEILYSKNRQWPREDMTALARTIIGCATAVPDLPVNAGNRFAVFTRMVCDAFSKNFGEAMQVQFTTYFKEVLEEAFLFYWGHQSFYPTTVGSSTSVGFVNEALAFCDFISGLNPKRILSHQDIKRYFRTLFTNATTVNHLLAIEIMLGTAGSYLWGDSSDPKGSAEAFVSEFMNSIISEYGRVAVTTNGSIPRGFGTTKDYVYYIADKAMYFAAYNAHYNSGSKVVGRN